MRIQAQFIVVESKRVLPDAQIEICDGRVVDLHESPSVQADWLLENSVILPGLINSHTHLEFSDLEKAFPAGIDFPGWIAQVVRHRRAAAERSSAEELENQRKTAIEQGLRECWRTGTAWVADIVTPSSPLSSYLALRDPNVFGVTILPEILGATPDGLRQSLLWAREIAANGTKQQNQNVQTSNRAKPTHLHFGLSPHAPYSLSRTLLTEPAYCQLPSDTLLAMHVAESEAERQWLESGTGPFREFFKSLGLPIDLPRMQIDEAIELLAESSRSMLIHGNYLKNVELDRIAETLIAVVYCPRTHEHFRHRAYPLKELLRRSIPVLLGTDSRASNPDLNLWQECKTALRNHPRWSAAAALDAVTKIPSQVLGLETELGTLDAGKVAWLNSMPTPIGATKENLIERLLSPSNPCSPQPVEISFNK